MDVYLTLNCRFFLSLLYNFFVENVGVRTIRMYYRKMCVRWLGQTTFEPSHSYV